MTPERFEHLLEDTITKIRSTLSNKGRVYAPGSDRLGNFKNGAKKRRTIPEDYLLSLQTKHQEAVEEFVAALKEGTDTDISEWEEKLIDEINYCILLLALIHDRHNSVGFKLDNAFTKVHAEELKQEVLRLEDREDAFELS